MPHQGPDIERCENCHWWRTSIADQALIGECRRQRPFLLSYLDNTALSNSVVLAPLTNGSTNEMLIDGSSSPEVFSVTPNSNELWAIKLFRMVFEIEAQLDFNKFANGAALANGVKIAFQSKGVSQELAPIKINSNFFEVFTVARFSQTVGAQMDFLQFTSSQDFILRGDLGDKIEITIEDDLPTVALNLLTFKAFAFGYSYEDRIQTRAPDDITAPAGGLILEDAIWPKTRPSQYCGNFEHKLESEAHPLLPTLA